MDTQLHPKCAWTALGVHPPFHTDITAGNGVFLSSDGEKGLAALKDALWYMSEARTQQQVTSSGDPPAKLPFSPGCPFSGDKAPLGAEVNPLPLAALGTSMPLRINISIPKFQFHVHQDKDKPEPPLFLLVNDKTPGILKAKTLGFFPVETKDTGSPTASLKTTAHV